MPQTKVATIELQPRTVTLHREGDFFVGNYSLNLTNARGFQFAARIEIKPEGAAGADWVSIPSDRKLVDFPADKLETIPVAVKVPATAATKAAVTHRFTVKVMDKALSDELTDTETADFVVPALHLDTPPRRWLIPAIVVAVLLLGGGGVAVALAMSGPELGDACELEKPECPEGITCHPTKKRCLAEVGKECTQGDVCVTGRCSDDKCERLQIGDACEPAEALCAEPLECAALAKKCQGITGVACKAADQCLSGKCEGDRCALLAANEPCDPGRSFCAPKLVCPVSSKRCAQMPRPPIPQPVPPLPQPQPQPQPPPRPAVASLAACTTRNVLGSYSGGTWMARQVCQGGEVAVSAGGFCSGAGRMVGASTTNGGTDGSAWLWCSQAGQAYWYGMCCQPSQTGGMGAPSSAVGNCVNRRVDATYSGGTWMAQAVCQPNEIAISAGGFCAGAGQAVGMSTTNPTRDRNAWLWCSQSGQAYWYATCCEPAASTRVIGTCTTRRVEARYPGGNWVAQTVCQADEIAVAGAGFCASAGQLVGASTTVGNVDPRVWLWCTQPGNAFWYGTCCKQR
jgi:hypothetical protein